MAETEVLSIRMPSVLKARLKARGEKLADLVCEACRVYLDGSSTPQVAPAPSVAPVKHESKMNAKMVDLLRAAPQDAPPDPITEVPFCLFKAYNEIDGEHYLCGKEAGHGIKHGAWISA